MIARDARAILDSAVPPNVDPIDRNYDPLIWRIAGLLGHAMALSLEEDGRSGTTP